MRRRLLLVTLAVTSLLIAAFAVPLGLLVAQVARDRAITDAERDTAALAPVLAVTTDRTLLTAAMQRTASGAEGRLTLWLAEGGQIGDQTAADADALGLARERRVAFSRATSAGIDIYTPVVLDRSRVAVLRVRVPEARLRHGVTGSWAILAALATTLLGAAVVVTDRLARSVTKPAADLAATSRALARGEIQARTTVGGPPEIADVGRALNVLADRIDQLLAGERERVADLSHRLRTPLTALRLSAESQGNAAILADVSRLESEVSELIRSARRPLHEQVLAVVDISEVVEERAVFWGALAEDDHRAWSLRIDPPGPYPVRLTASDAAALIDVLLGNVFVHTPDGSPYRVSVSGGAGGVLVAVDDGGPGFDEAAAIPRGASGGESTGLGLDIAVSTVRSAGGTLRVEPSDLGGASVILELPLVGDPS